MRIELHLLTKYGTCNWKRKDFMKLTWKVLEPRANDLTLESPFKSVYKLLKSGSLQMESIARPRLDKFANSYFLGLEKSTIERTSSDGALICSGQHLIKEVGIDK